ncbi:hypothetical protein Hanom_Chr12g01085681 [Helianthus anomalus]
MFSNLSGSCVLRAAHYARDASFKHGMHPSSTGCVLRAKPNKKWTRGHGMRPSSTGCVFQVSETSGEVSDELQVSNEFSGELFPASY